MPLVEAMRCCTREGSKAMISEDEQASLSTDSPVFEHRQLKQQGFARGGAKRICDAEAHAQSGSKGKSVAGDVEVY